MDEKGRFRIAVVGCGSLGCAQHLPNIVADPRFELLWCCERDGQRLGEVAEQFCPRHSTTDAAEVFGDPEVEGVVISTPSSVRRELVEAACETGKGVYVEKPVADTLEELEAISRLVAERPIPFCVGHNRRSAPATAAAKAVFDRHRASPASPPWRFERHPGERPDLPEEKQAMALARINDDTWSWKLYALDTGIVIYELTHFVDLISYFFGSDPVSVAGLGSPRVNGVLSLKYADGSLGCIFYSGVGSFGYPKELWEFYTYGAIIVNDQFTEVRVAGVPGEEFRRKFPLQDGTDGGTEDYYERIREAQRHAVAAGDTSLLPTSSDRGHRAHLWAFAEHVRGLRPSPADLRSAVVATLTCLRAYDAMESGREVAVELPDWVPARGRNP